MAKILGAIFFSAVIFTVTALPMVRKQGDKQRKQAEANSVLEAELGKLKQDGVTVEKTEQVVSETVDGKTQTSKTEKETVADAKTGEVVAAVSKTVTKDEKGEKKEQAHVDVPAAGVHQDVNGAEAENFDLLPADDVARYIFDTSDVEGVRSAVNTLVEKKKISKKAAEDYITQIHEKLNVLHDEALKEVTAEMEARRKEENEAYKDMISLAEMLNENSQTEQALYLYAKKLYLAYRTEGDEYAKEILIQFTNELQKEAEAGNLEEAVQNHIYDLILKALKDANETFNFDSDGTAASDSAEAKSKLPKD